MTELTLEQRQLQLEDECTLLGVQRYNRERMPWHMENGKLANLSEQSPGAELIRRAVIPTADSLREWVKDCLEGRARRAAPYARIVDAFPEVEAVAYIACKLIISSWTADVKLTNLATHIGKWLVFEYNLLQFKEQHPGYFHVLTQSLRERTQNVAHSARVLGDGMRKSGMEIFELDAVGRGKLGVRLCQTFIEATGLAEIVKKRTSKTKTNNYIVPTQETSDWLAKQHELCSMSTPMRLPMVCTPNKWDSIYGGGYLTPGFAGFSMIKSDNKRVLEHANETDMPDVFEALNAIQETAWQINPKVAETMRALWNEGAQVAGMPSRDDAPLPARPAILDDYEAEGTPQHEEALRKYKAECRHTHSYNRSLLPNRLKWMQRLWIAEKFKPESAIYFPHQLDWRGRAYPVPSIVQPQADDAGKSLLRFAEGKPLGETGGFWLAVHLANNWAEDNGDGRKTDKLSLEDRVKWAEQHSDMICLVANAPMDYLWWTQADKPWQFLAACFEWDQFMQEGNDFVSHLPVAMDGSCNGLQHYSMMLRDHIGGAAVNLTPSDTPNDIYALVAEETSRLISADLQSLDGPVRTHAQMWDGKVNRSVVKRPTMTTPYGVTTRGMFQQTLDMLSKEARKGKPIVECDPEALPKAVDYLSTRIGKGISSVVVAADQAMGWLQDTARTMSKVDVPIKWVTPIGFAVMQDYQKQDAKRIATHIGEIRIRSTIYMPNGKLDRGKQKMGIAPNFVHSLDASHMMSTVLLCKGYGVDSFAMVHDSFATHASDVEAMQFLLRTAFVEMYTPDVLNDYRDQLIAQVDDETASKIKETPAYGQLDAAAVMESDFFFA